MHKKYPGSMLLKTGKSSIEINHHVYPVKKKYRNMQLVYQIIFCIIAVVSLLFSPDYLPFPFFLSLGLTIVFVLALWFLIPFLIGFLLPKDMQAYIEK